MRCNIGAVDVFNSHYRVDVVQETKLVEMLDQVIWNPTDRDLAGSGQKHCMTVYLIIGLIDQ